jgi:Domain of unknown function (DUF4338)
MPVLSKSDNWITALMERHYSQPKGFVARLLLYGIIVDGTRYGAIAGGSATKFLPGRNEFFSIGKDDLNSIINNTFFHIEKVNGRYPFRNFASCVVGQWRETVALDWERVYGNNVVGFETLVELPRIGTLYLRDGWREVGITKGHTCKRVAGKGTDSWTGKRIWNTTELKPKRVFCFKRPFTVCGPVER